VSPQEVVLAFVANLGFCLEALRSNFVSVTRDSPTDPLTARTASGEAVRSGRVEGLGTFKLHGIGCRVDMDSGEVLDFDWNQNGIAVFDDWRLREFARSVGSEEAQKGALVAACTDLAAAGLLVETEPGWFAILAASNGEKIPMGQLE
jgi:hypothetical protein